MAKEKNLPELAEDYYLTNFKLLLDFLEETYSDILYQRDKAFLTDFDNLSKNAQLLYVRLVLRTKNIFLAHKLNYQEINIPKAVEELNEFCFIEINPELFFEDYTELFTVNELLDFSKLLGQKLVRSKRVKVLEKLRDRDQELFDIIKEEYQILLILEAERVQRFIFTFFGNLYEGMDRFILEDLGVRKYEGYTIDKKSRLFKSRIHLNAALKLDELHSELWEAVEQRDHDLVDDLIIQIQEVPIPAVLKKKRSKSLNLAARFYERVNEDELALELYAKSTLPPSNERRVRILDKQEKYLLSLKYCQKMTRDPFSTEELDFALSFQEVLKRKLGRSYKKRQRAAHLQEEILALTWDPQGRVESQVLNYLIKEQGIRGFFCENYYWCALSVLFFWEEFWKEGPEVFYHPFEGRPRDLLSGGFYMRQREALENKIKYWKVGGDNFFEEIIKIYDNKKDVYCDFINWKKLNRESLLLLLKNTPLEVCLEIGVQILKEPRDFRRGLPDLFLVTYRGYELAEVKSPNDQVQKSQKRWFKFFSEKKINYTIYRLKT